MGQLFAHTAITLFFWDFPMSFSRWEIFQKSEVRYKFRSTRSFMVTYIYCILPLLHFIANLTSRHKRWFFHEFKSSFHIYIRNMYARTLWRALKSKNLLQRGTQSLLMIAIYYFLSNVQNMLNICAHDSARENVIV